MSMHASDQQRARVGLIVLALLAVAMAAAFNLQKFPGFRGTTYHAEFADASGLHVGGRVEIAGIRVGRVDAIKIDGTKILVDFDVKGGHRLGSDTTAAIKVLNLLGEKFLDIVPRGNDSLAAGSTIPLSRTTSGYDIVSTLTQLTHTTDELDTTKVADALTTVSDTLDEASPEIRGSFQGVARLSQTIADNDQDLEALLDHAASVAKTVEARRTDLMHLITKSDQIFRELIKRRHDIHRLLVAARELSEQLTGLVKDNEKQIGPALTDLQTAMNFLNERDQQIGQTIKYYAPYASILINIIGTGPWFDAYVPNIVGTFTGEFKPGFRPGMH